MRAPAAIPWRASPPRTAPGPSSRGRPSVRRCSGTRSPVCRLPTPRRSPPARRPALQQLTPTATISSTPAATSNASASGCPARVWSRRWCSSATPARRPCAPGRPGLRFVNVGHGFASQHVGARVGQPSPAAADATATTPQRKGRTARGIRSRRPTPRRRARPRPQPGGRRRRPRHAPPRARSTLRRSSSMDSLAADPASRKAVERRLVARGRRDRGAGPKVGLVHRDDFVRRVR